MKRNENRAGRGRAGDVIPWANIPTALNLTKNGEIWEEMILFSYLTI